MRILYISINSQRYIEKEGTVVKKDLTRCELVDLYKFYFEGLQCLYIYLNNDIHSSVLPLQEYQLPTSVSTTIINNICYF